MNNNYLRNLSLAFAGLAIFSTTSFAQSMLKADPGNAGLKLPENFGALVVASNLGQARHITVDPKGDVFVKLERLKDGKGILKLTDSDGDGKADKTTSFGNYVGTGIGIKNGYLYAASNSGVFRYALNNEFDVVNPDNPEKIVTGLWDHGEHNAKSIALDNSGNIYVNIGAPSNACQVANRQQNSPGMDPCPILDSAGGIWQFKTDKINQSYKEGTRYVTGTRNVVALTWNDAENELYGAQHGRDQFNQLYPAMYTVKESAIYPAEELFAFKKGFNGGWPYCYYNQDLGQKILSPEYGGDSKKQGRCDIMEKPLVGFPGHMAPNAVLIYTGDMFPAKYKNGAFIAFHGSWNRSPEPQAGYFVVFQPLKDGKPDGQWEVFADGFANKAEVINPREAQYRPCGLAMGPDGSIYISDDVKGNIWRIFYNK